MRTGPVNTQSGAPGARDTPNGAPSVSERAGTPTTAALSIVTRSCVLSLCLILPACDQSQEPPPAASTTATAHDITITLSLSDTSLTTVDRTSLTVDLTYPPETLPAFTPPITEAIEAAGWIVVSAETAEPRLAPRDDAGRLRRRTTATIEPSLPGELPIPAFTVALPNGDAVTTEPLPITVATLLPEDDPLADAPELTQERDTPPDPRASPLPFIVAGGAVLVGAITAIALFLRRKPKAQDPRADLRRLARLARRIADRDALAQQDLDTLDRALREAIRLAGANERDHAELLARLERARFGPLPPPPEAARDLAEHTAASVRTMQESHARRIGEPSGEHA